MDGGGRARTSWRSRASRAWAAMCVRGHPAREEGQAPMGWVVGAGPGDKVMEACGAWRAGLAVVGRGRCGGLLRGHSWRGFIQRFLGTSHVSSGSGNWEDGRQNRP